MKFANESKAVVFFIYECEDRHFSQHKGVLLEDVELGKYGYFKLAHYLKNNEVVTVLYDDYNMYMFDTSKNKVYDFSLNWRVFLKNSNINYQEFISHKKLPKNSLLIKRALKDGVISQIGYNKIESLEKSK